MSKVMDRTARLAVFKKVVCAHCSNGAKKCEECEMGETAWQKKPLKEFLQVKEGGLKKWVCT